MHASEVLRVSYSSTIKSKTHFYDQQPLLKPTRNYMPGWAAERNKFCFSTGIIIGEKRIRLLCLHYGREPICLEELGKGFSG